ncbi:MAG TPA: class II D-tagatose-bisphosphate aldolase, non-catalytic subunit [Anaerolineales bacterium]|nr:class II D-tagatose-bisphosphate aldolase, non-catalytic subunit [Anaerolineales bacterium]
MTCNPPDAQPMANHWDAHSSRGEKNASEGLLEILRDQKRGLARGIYSICSANRFVIEACMQQADQNSSPLLIEATCNQVNQYGGYTGMNPRQFVQYVQEIAASRGFPTERIILGGDHLGPGPWQTEDVRGAMEKARQLVHDFVQAGCTKIHLDASMRCADDAPERPLDPQIAAERASELCQVAEAAAVAVKAAERPLYIIGTEVPPPGGSQEKESSLLVTTVEHARQTIELIQSAFQVRGLDSTWERVIGLVVQPGVEYGDDALFEYDRSKARPLSEFIETLPNLVYEAHSTDYQSCRALQQMVEDHFAILKVGPALTFAFREAVFALAMMEQEWLAHRPGVALSRFFEILDEVLSRDPLHYVKYYEGDKSRVAFARKYSFSDRIRYYWNNSEIERALSRLLENLARNPPPLTLISQFLPVQYQNIRTGKIGNHPRQLVWDRIREVAACYSQACSNSYDD